ncbi:MAG: hypothetical protein KDB48_00990 [Solirubrobacterales bacterium]|nr:hypothetical protein [Solirubrobacterales bacterium]HMT04835.1 hypothetical protein [Solirubrobacterales bacterium]
MAQTKKKRTRKKRGTQAGSIETKRRSRPRSRAEARNQAKSGGGRTLSKGDNPPTWKGAVIRGLVASLIFVVLLILIFGRNLTGSLAIGLLMLVFYIPAGYYMDLFLWRRRERQRIRAKSKG